MPALNVDTQVRCQQIQLGCEVFTLPTRDRAVQLPHGARMTVSRESLCGADVTPSSVRLPTGPRLVECIAPGLTIYAADDTTSTRTVYHFPIGCCRNRISWMVPWIVICPVRLLECGAANLHAVDAIL